MTTTIYDARTSAGDLEVTIVTDCLDLDAFTTEFSNALLKATRSISNRHAEKIDVQAFSRIAMSRAFKVGFKVAGYKSDEVGERRLLSCGPASFSDSAILGDSRGVQS